MYTFQWDIVIHDDEVLNFDYLFYFSRYRRQHVRKSSISDKLGWEEMRSTNKEMAHDILTNKVDAKTLAVQYPEYKQEVLDSFSKAGEDKNSNLTAIIAKYKDQARFAIEKIKKSGLNDMTINAFLPSIIKARIALDIIDEINFASKTGKFEGRVRFNLWDGWILQKILFKRALQRKPVSLVQFRLIWPFITNKKILMPLVNREGIYCFYTKELLTELSKIICDSKCLEIGAGDGTLTSFLKEYGINCIATDDYSWTDFIKYPDFVERLDAKAAIDKYKPESVICSWAPPSNAFEKSIFKSNSVNLYIAIGTKNPAFSGNHDSYNQQSDFDMEYDERLSSLLVPPSKDNAVYIFRRR